MFIAEKPGDYFSTNISPKNEIHQIALRMAHEIGNPLTVIKGYLQYFKNKPERCGRDYRTLLFQEVTRIESLLNSFILLANNAEVRKTPQNLNELLQQIYPSIQRFAFRQNITTQMFLYDKLPLIICNEEEIRQLVMNLVRNGIEAMSCGRITVGTTREPGRVVLFVRDEGNGISPEQMPRIFNPFYTTKNGRSGLGLAVSQTIVERHQGRIEIVANRTAGTTFRVLFREIRVKKE